MNQSKNSNNVHACEGVAVCPIDDSDTLQNAKLRAKELAKIDACKKIDDYINLFFKNKDFKLPDDEISSISIKISNIVDVKYNLQNLDNDNMLIRAAVTAQFDDNDILNHLDKFFREKSALVEQNEELKQKLSELEKQQDKDYHEKLALIAENDELKRKIAALEKNLVDKSAVSAQNETKIFQNPPLADQKFDEAWKLFCRRKYYDAIKLYDEIIKSLPNAPKPYFYRGRCYQELGNNEKARADFAKSKALAW